MQLVISNGSAGNPQTLDLTNYIRVSDGEGMSTYDPAASEKIISHSLLREGGVLALEDLKARELVFPLHLHAASASALVQLVAQVNQILTASAMSVSWQDDNLSQPTIFDGISGQYDIEYSYRRAQAPHFYCSGKLRLFVQPLGRAASPRRYATASGVGPLLMISPYASGGGQVIGGSTQATVAGYGGAQAGGVPSGGVFYWGAPSLAGDAQTQLQISYVAPLPASSSGQGKMPYIAVSRLPDQYYRPLITVAEVSVSGTASHIGNQQSVASQYLSVPSAFPTNFVFKPQSIASTVPGFTTDWAGQHRLFAIARASGAARYLQTITNPLVQRSTTASVNTGDWGVYDLGTFALRASEPNLLLSGAAGHSYVNVGAPSSAGFLDLGAFVMLPDNATWFFNPTTASAYSGTVGPPGGIVGGDIALPQTNTFLLDDVIGDQFNYGGATQTFAPSPIGMTASSVRLTQYTRGLPPRPDPGAGIPIIAILGVGQNGTPKLDSSIYGITGGSWANPQNVLTLAQINVLERTRFVLP